MSANGVSNFVEWKEQFVSQERGSRVVHYFLKNSAGDSFLAVIGTERSLRHMVYVVAEEFLQVYGSEKSNISSFKWRSRREVVDWLTSLLSKQHQSSDQSKSTTDGSPQNSSVDLLVSGLDEPVSYLPNRVGNFGRNLKGYNQDVVWSGSAWTCGKQLKHYQAFCRNGTTIPIHSFVLVMAKEENHYLAYLEDMYEDKKGQKKVKVRWFHQNQEVIGTIPPPTPHPREVFITSYSQVISVECVDGLAAILTPDHYEKWLEALPSAFSGSIHLCFRQFRNNLVKPFNLSKLRGYFDQPVLSCLDLHPKLPCNGSAEEEDEELSNGGTIRRGVKRSRTSKGRQRFTMSHPGARISGRGSHIRTCGMAYRNLRFGLPGRRLQAVKNARSLRLKPPFKVGDKIELLCQDSGIRGCWFRCMIIEFSRKQLKVRYDDLHNEDGCGNLEEWIPAFRSAAPDKLGMRCLGRLTIRPCPPHENLSEAVFEIGTPVDAWWNDGWWEGVVTGLDIGKDDELQVYFPGEEVFVTVERRNLRISRDWLDNRWVDIEVTCDILSAVSSVSPGTKVSSASITAKGAESGGSAMSERVALTNSGHDTVEKDKQALAGAAKTAEWPENATWVNLGKQDWIGHEIVRDDNENENDDDGDSDDAQDDNDNVDDEYGKSVMELNVGSTALTCEAVPS